MYNIYRKIIIKHFAQLLAVGFYYFPNDTKIVILGSELTEKLGVPIKRWASVGSIQNDSCLAITRYRRTSFESFSSCQRSTTAGRFKTAESVFLKNPPRPVVRKFSNPPPPHLGGENSLHTRRRACFVFKNESYVTSVCLWEVLLRVVFGIRPLEETDRKSQSHL